MQNLMHRGRDNRNKFQRRMQRNYGGGRWGDRKQGVRKQGGGKQRLGKQV